MKYKDLSVDFIDENLLEEGAVDNSEDTALFFNENSEDSFEETLVKLKPIMETEIVNTEREDSMSGYGKNPSGHAFFFLVVFAIGIALCFFYKKFKKGKLHE